MKPGHPIREDIAREVRAVVLARRGVDQAITGEELAAEVARRLELGGLSPRTVLRRCQEAISAMVDAGERIASSSAGYCVPETPEELATGERSLVAQLTGTARRLRAYRRAEAEEILAILGQGALVATPRQRKPRRALITVGQLQLGGLA